MEAYSPVVGNFLGGAALLTTPVANLNVVNEQNIKRLLTVLSATFGLGSDAAKRYSQQTTIRAFRQKTPHQQIQFIDALWNLTADPYAFDTLASHMYEPNYDVPDNANPLPSSWSPDPNAPNTYRKRLAGKMPWQEFGVGFRIDGSTSEDKERVTNRGLTQQRLNLPFMRGRRGQEIEGTVINNQDHARFWTGNHDIFNETAVCVSRNFFGATAFPERDTGQDGGKDYYLWAVNCEGLRGFDCERQQLINNRQWRPGEKAFHSIPPERIIAFVKVKRFGVPVDPATNLRQGGWIFEIDANANWEFIHYPTPGKLKYIQAELNAWKGIRHTIPAAFDFA